MYGERGLMYPPQQPAPPRRKKSNKTLLTVLISVLAVLALCLVVTVVYGVTNDRKKAENTATTQDAAAADNGIPPTPGPDAWKAYIAALKAIDPDIVGNKDEKTIIDRGRSQCTSVRETPNDQAKLIELTNRRFTSPSHPNGFGDEKSTKILTVVRQYICPTY
ncbi:hypothetical protein [Dactylosporangium sp. NPDC000521]|uniref:hypothetical protein n=1 Tax=Dactylosporangium sp. NPDC000521 TaxID=3363975 RepID=UPI0036CB847A